MIPLVNGGSWAAGRLLHTVEELLSTGDCLPVVLCGRDLCLYHRVRSMPGVVAVPWTTDVPQWLAAADVLVGNAGGQTCFEALASGTPVVLYRPLPGHGRLNAEALAASGLATYARTAADLRTAINNPGPVPVFRGRDPADVVMAAVAQLRSAPE
jgi:UDP-N-acetylglucosamine:LPS N-acetylglucosamine transferase